MAFRLWFFFCSKGLGSDLQRTCSVRVWAQGLGVQGLGLEGEGETRGEQCNGTMRDI